MIGLTVRHTCSADGSSDKLRCPLRSPVSAETRAMAASKNSCYSEPCY